MLVASQRLLQALCGVLPPAIAKTIKQETEHDIVSEVKSFLMLKQAGFDAVHAVNIEHSDQFTTISCNNIALE